MSEDGRRRTAADWLVCLLTALVTTLGTWNAVVGWLPRPVIVPLAAAQGLSLLARRRAPLAVLATTTVIGTFMIAVGYGAGDAVFGTCCAAYAVALYWGQDVALPQDHEVSSPHDRDVSSPRDRDVVLQRDHDAALQRDRDVGSPRDREVVLRRGRDAALYRGRVGAFFRGGDEGTDLPGTLRGAAAVLAAGVVFMVTALTPGSRSHQDVWNALPAGLMVVSAWILGYAIRTRRAYIAELEDRAARLEAEEGERAARAVADERLRIARELHDVIGHSISLIAIQSEAAARSARTNPAAVPGFLATISTTSREALTEMRRVLAVLRPDQEADLSPQPGLEALEELVARLEAGGLKTRLDVEPLELPPGIALAVYRIVQESLTNVLKHAGSDARAGVTIARSGASVHVSVHDDGAGPSGRTSSAAQGIIGMHERVTLYGGTLRTGARPTGGFEVDAWLPLPEEIP